MLCIFTLIKKKETKLHPENFEQKLAVNSTFSDVIKVALNKQEVVKKQEKQRKTSIPNKLIWGGIYQYW